MLAAVPPSVAVADTVCALALALAEANVPLATAQVTSSLPTFPVAITQPDTAAVLFPSYVLSAAVNVTVTGRWPTASVPLPVEESPGTAGFEACTVDAVDPAGVALVVVTVSVEVLAALSPLFQ